MNLSNLNPGDVININELTADQQNTINGTDGKNLIFISTKTVEMFKKDRCADAFKIRKRATDGKLFFTCGGSVGSISLKGIPTKPMVSLCLGKAKDSNGNIIAGKASCFYLCHDEGDSTAEVVATW